MNNLAKSQIQTAFFLILFCVVISGCGGVMNFDDGPLFEEASPYPASGRLITFMSDDAMYPSLFSPTIQLNDNKPIKINPGAYHDYKVEPGMYFIRFNGGNNFKQNIVIEVDAGEVVYIKTYLTLQKILEHKRNRDLRKTRKQYSNTETLPKLSLSGRAIIVTNNRGSRIVNIINSGGGEINKSNGISYLTAGKYIAVLTHKQLIGNNMIQFGPYMLDISVKENCAYIINTKRPDYNSVNFEPKEYCLN